jgi:phenylpropionate dioxygenase-like ring-hydroxylating dioxygenase large terminal subunit
MSEAAVRVANGFTSHEAGFHQSWFPVGLANEISDGAVVGVDFLGTRVVMYRDPAGNPVVQNAWCPHLGADLSIGQLAEGQMRCAYHHWRFDAHGRCVDIPTGDKIPPGARIPTYPTAEAWGLVWAFNGETPLFGLPNIPDADEAELAFDTRLRGIRQVPGWVSLTNAVDFQHLRTLHNLPLAATPRNYRCRRVRHRIPRRDAAIPAARAHHRRQRLRPAYPPREPRQLYAVHRRADRPRAVANVLHRRRPPNAGERRSRRRRDGGAAGRPSRLRREAARRRRAGYQHDPVQTRHSGRCGPPSRPVFKIH